MLHEKRAYLKVVYDLDKIQINVDNGFDNLANVTELFGAPKFSAQEIAYLNANYACASMNNGNGSGFEGGSLCQHKHQRNCYILRRNRYIKCQ